MYGEFFRAVTNAKMFNSVLIKESRAMDASDTDT